MSNLAIIPARGGSKRIPRKNIKNFLGRPIISYSIQRAIESRLFEEVMVSTEDSVIANVALSYGAKIPFLRSEKNSDDFSTTVDVLLEVIREYQSQGKIFKNVCCIYPTAPFVNAAKLQKAHSILEENYLDGVFPVVAYGSPIQRSLKIISKKVKFNFPEFEKYRSQDLEINYHDAGQFYFLNVAALVKNKSLISENTSGMIISELEAQDIDNQVDWKLAELKYELL